MAKFIFLCRRCGKKFKQHGSTLQVAREMLSIRLGGRRIGEDQGFMCGKCSMEDYYESIQHDRGTYVEEDNPFFPLRD